MLLTGRPGFDALLALGIGAWLMVTTLRELRALGNELIWPEDARCPHHELGTAPAGVYLTDA